MASPYLTKSRFKLATECPRKLVYTGQPEYANTKNDDEFLQSLAEGGYQVGELAKLMFSGGVEITSRGHQAQLEETTQALQAQQADRVVLFEAALRHERCFVRADILVKEGRQVRLIEVKSKSYDPEDPHFFRGKRGQLSSEMRPYLLDIAFQTLVARRAMPDCEVCASLLLPDKGKCASVDGLNGLFPVERMDAKNHRIEVKPRPGLTLSDTGEPILTELDVTAYVDDLLAQVHTFPGATGTIEQLAHQWAQQYETGTSIDPPIQAQCKACEFRAPRDTDQRCGLSECWEKALHLNPEALTQRLVQPLVLDLWDGRRTDRWMGEGKYLLEQLDLSDLADSPVTQDDRGLTRVGRQWLQISGEHLNAQGYQFLKDEAAAEMAAWRYPLNFIDFETSRTALPFHRGERPFGLVAFQFSHHVLHQDGSLEHAGEFLCTDPGVHPNLTFLRALQKTLASNAGTVLMWSPYENSVLNELRRQLIAGDWGASDAASLIDFIDTITVRKQGAVLEWEGQRAMQDMKPVSSAVFFHKRAGGSNSIKKVLPAMLQASDWLRQAYSQPVYGGGRTNSRNFAGPMTWWQVGPDGLPIDPYRLLPPVYTDLPVLPDEEDGGTTLSQGGAALMAYARLQFEDIGAERRQAWNQALLRYCELDTLAMAMIVQGWRAWL